MHKLQFRRGVVQFKCLSQREGWTASTSLRQTDRQTDCQAVHNCFGDLPTCVSNRVQLILKCHIASTSGTAIGYVESPDPFGIKKHSLRAVANAGACWHHWDRQRVVGIEMGNHIKDLHMIQTEDETEAEDDL